MLQRQVSDASERCRDDHSEVQFLLEVAKIEARAERAAVAITKLNGFPDYLKLKIARAIDKASTSEALAYRLATRSSDLISSLHSIFHEIASLRIQTPFGVLSDDPEGALKRLDGNGKNALEEHIDECEACKTLATLGAHAFCDAANDIEKQWIAVNDLMAEGVPHEEWPK